MKAGEKPRTQHRPAANAPVFVPALMTVITCPECGTGVDLWTSDEETRCDYCEYTIFKKQRVDH